jgi:hypothetical protein
MSAAAISRHPVVGLFISPPNIASRSAVSRPPFLTAVALWPNGDGWGGGELFARENWILLNHRPDEMSLAEGFKLPRHVSISPFGARPGWGEDGPILSDRLTRRNWRLVQPGKPVERDYYGRKGRQARVWIEHDPPEIWAKASSGRAPGWTLQMMVRGIHERDGPWYLTEYAIANAHTERAVSLGRMDWADWPSGDLLFGKEGQIFRLRVEGRSGSPSLSEARLLIDLTDATFEQIECPDEQKHW